jgi:hypothetical protein
VYIISSWIFVLKQLGINPTLQETLIMMKEKFPLKDYPYISLEE